MKSTIKCLVIILVLSISSFAQIYVSPQGDDSNPGTLDLPLKTVAKAVSLAYPDTVIYLRGGVYSLSTTLKPGRSGTAGHYIKMFAYPGEVPVLDFSGESYSSSSRGVSITKDYWYLKGIYIGNAGDNGVYISGGYNIIENCQIYNNKDTGLQISSGGHDNLIYNCDAYDNNDPATGGQNADGIDVKLEAGPGNVLRGCRVYDNADDGFDCYETAYRVVFDSCWAFHNGYNLWNIQGFTGNGNGFKLGGNYYAGPHIVTNCISFDNVVKGFDQNNNTAGVTLYNCTSFRNATNFSFPTVPKVGVDTLYNNLSISPKSADSKLEANAIQVTNSWQGFTVTSADFISMDTSLARVGRLNDGSLPYTDFLRLATASPLIDAGTNVGIAFNGKAPDLGAFESGYPTGINDNNPVIPNEFSLYQNYPNPFNPSTIISWQLSKSSFVTLKVYDILGREVATLVNEFQKAGRHNVVFNAQQPINGYQSAFKNGVLTSGVYIYQLHAGESILSRKMILAK